MNRRDHNSKVIRRIAIIFSGITLSIAIMAFWAMKSGHDIIPPEVAPVSNDLFTTNFTPADPCGLDVITCTKTKAEIISLLEKYAPNKKIFEASKRIAVCESKFDQYARNPNSSAKGLFQFTDRTWEKYCTGNVFDADDNICCFMKLYPEHPTWWQCR